MTHNFTYEEIKRQPDTWKQTIDTVLHKRKEFEQLFTAEEPDEVVFIGSGTSYYISITAALTFQEQTGIAAKPVPASEIFLKPDAVIAKNKKTLMVAFSRSGNTTEVVRAIEFVQNNELATCLAITGNLESDMAQKTAHTIVLPHIQEKSVVMTGSYTNMLLTSQLLAGIVSRDETYLSELKELPGIGGTIMPQAETMGQKLGGELEYAHFIYLGLGSYLGLALEGMLKMKEMTQAFAEAFNPLEFRHGPISVINEECRVILMSHRSLQSYEPDVITDVRRLGANTVVIGDDLDGFDSDETFELGSRLSDQSRGILYLPLLQWLAYFRTVKMGLNPDKPRNLNQVVVLEDTKGE